MPTAYFKSKLDERMWKIEGLFAEAKNNHGLRRAKYRGRDKMQIQAYMTAFVQNLKRLVQRDFSGLMGHIYAQLNTKLKIASLKLLKIFAYEIA